METLFEFDMKNYNPNGKINRRPSVRAVVVRENKVMMIYSQKLDYYKFPGGGIKHGETHEEALAREVQEETGYRVIPGSMKDFGLVVRRQEDSIKPNEIFEQENFYYRCEVGEEAGEKNLDDYEAKEGFTTVWIDAMEAARHNHDCKTVGSDPFLVKREEKVLTILHEIEKSKIVK